MKSITFNDNFDMKEEKLSDIYIELVKKFEDIKEFDYKHLQTYKEKGEPCYFYIIKYLKSNNKILHYCGITQNFNRRYKEHHNHHRFKNNPHKVIWIILFNNRGEAATFENWSKGRGPMRSLRYDNIFRNSIPYYKSLKKKLI